MENLNFRPELPKGLEISNAFNTGLPVPEDFCENAILPLHCINGSGIIIWSNQSELDFLGYSKEEYVNKHVSNFHLDKHVSEDILDRLMKQQKLVNYYARLISKNGEIKHVLINSNVFFKEGKFSHTRCFTTDITELKKAEQHNLNLIAQLQDRNVRLQWQSGNIKRSA